MRDKYTVLSLILSVIILLPVLNLFFYGADVVTNIPPDYLRSAITDSTFISLKLILLTLFFSLLWAVPAAFFFAFNRIKYKKLLVVLATAPLAVPAYLNAFAAADMIGGNGYLRRLLKETEIYAGYWPEIKSLTGAALILSLALYPYIFLPLYIQLRKTPVNLIDYALSTGSGKISAIFHTVRPQIIPPVIFGLSLVMMETLTDYGVSAYFGVKNLSVFLFDIWKQTGNISYAINISFIYLIFSFFIIKIQKIYSKKKENKESGKGERTHNDVFFSSAVPVKICVSFLCLIPAYLGFFFPLLRYFYYLYAYSHADAMTENFIGPAFNSFTAALLTAFLCVMCAVIFNYALSLRKSKILTLCITPAISLYAFPAVMLGVGVMVFVNRFDGVLNDFLFQYFNFKPGALLGGGVIGLLYAYHIRFMTVSHGYVREAFENVKRSVVSAALSMNRSKSDILFKISLPLAKNGMIGAFAFVFVDVIKELPLTLTLRPINYETFATYAYNSASLEQIEKSAPSALAIIFISAVMSLMLLRKIK